MKEANASFADSLTQLASSQQIAEQIEHPSGYDGTNFLGMRALGDFPSSGSLPASGPTLTHPLSSRLSASPLRQSHIPTEERGSVGAASTTDRGDSGSESEGTSTLGSAIEFASDLSAPPREAPNDESDLTGSGGGVGGDVQSAMDASLSFLTRLRRGSSAAAEHARTSTDPTPLGSSKDREAISRQARSPSLPMGTFGHPMVVPASTSALHSSEPAAVGAFPSIHSRRRSGPWMPPRGSGQPGGYGRGVVQDSLSFNLGGRRQASADPGERLASPGMVSLGTKARRMSVGFSDEDEDLLFNMSELDMGSQGSL